MPTPFGQVPVMGIVWYLEQDYPAVLRLMADAHLLPRSFQQWQDKAQRAERDLRAQGITPVRAILDPAAFPEWCRRNGQQVDAKGRMAFANDHAYRHGRN
jgi:hypothetical protein